MGVTLDHIGHCIPADTGPPTKDQLDVYGVALYEAWKAEPEGEEKDRLHDCLLDVHTARQLLYGDGTREPVGVISVRSLAAVVQYEDVVLLADQVRRRHPETPAARLGRVACPAT